MQRRAARPTSDSLPLTVNQDGTSTPPTRKVRRGRRNLKRKGVSAQEIAFLCCVSIAVLATTVFMFVRRNPVLQGSNIGRDGGADGDFAILRSPLFSFGEITSGHAPASAKCKDLSTVSLLDRARLDKSLALGTRFQADHQREGGNFDYEFDWVTKENSQDDSSVRQAGALWGMSLIFHDMMEHAAAEGALSSSSWDDGSDRRDLLRKTADRIKRGIEFFRKNSRVLKRPIDGDSPGVIDKMRYVTYPGEKNNSQGCQALLCLSLIDFLRALGSPSDAAVVGVSADEMLDIRNLLDELLPFLVTQHSDLPSDRFFAWDLIVQRGEKSLSNGRWYGEGPDVQSSGTVLEKWWDDNSHTKGYFYENYDIHGKRKGASSPYFDGESLLAVIKAAKYLGHAYAYLWPLASGTARSLHDIHVVKALRIDEDSDYTKGVYQWLSMSLFELCTVTFGTGRTEMYDLPSAIERLHNVDEFGSWLIDLALWMIDVHETLRKQRNTGYAYEGIVPAWAWGTHLLQSKAHEDEEMEDSVQKLHCTIHEGINKLIGWQVGMGAEKRGTWDGRTGLGGVQNSEDESGLRIDVTQHQMHATILTRRYVYPEQGASWPWSLALGK